MTMTQKKGTLAAICALLFMSFFSQLNAAMLSWQDSGDKELAGFHVYYGTEPGVYTDTLDVGNVSSYTLPELEAGECYYFSVTSYDHWGNESDFSAEVCYTAEQNDTATDVGEEGQNGTMEFQLIRNYPNPFNPETTIPYSVAAPGQVKLVIYNVSGKPVKVLVDRTAGGPLRDEAVWDGTDENGISVASGVYLCRLEQNSRSQLRRLVLAR